MKIKIPITDQFLWDLYEFLKPVANVADILFIPRTPYQLQYRLFNERSKIFRKYKERMNDKKFSKLIYRLKKIIILKQKNFKVKNL